MRKINCLIIDDEPVARDIIKGYCVHFPELEVLASCGNALEAKALLQEHQVDLLFLDINMPVIDGLSFARTLKTGGPQVIFTTAYREFAPEAFDLDACDYLLKPFSLERFIMALDKARLRLQLPEAPRKPVVPAAGPAQAIGEDYVFIRTDGRIYKVKHGDILYAEAQGNYTRIVTESGQLMPKLPFSAFEEMLPASVFLRTHRSFIINKSRIDHIEGNRVLIRGMEIPVGSSYRDALLSELGYPK